jgi:hypothetical protein
MVAAWGTHNPVCANLQGTRHLVPLTKDQIYVLPTGDYVRGLRFPENLDLVCGIS